MQSSLKRLPADDRSAVALESVVELAGSQNSSSWRLFVTRQVGQDVSHVVAQVERPLRLRAALWLVIAVIGVSSLILPAAAAYAYERNAAGEIVESAIRTVVDASANPAGHDAQLQYGRSFSDHDALRSYFSDRDRFELLVELDLLAIWTVAVVHRLQIINLYLRRLSDGLTASLPKQTTHTKGSGQQ